MIDNQTMVNLISNTTTKNRLSVACQVDPRDYEKGKKISDETMAAIDLEPVGEFGKWNYKIGAFCLLPTPNYCLTDPYYGLC